MTNHMVANKIIASFEDLAGDVVRETVSVPKDIAGKALESLGGGSGQKPQKSPISGSVNIDSEKPTAWEEIDKVNDLKARRAMARPALEELLRKPPKPKEPSIWDKIQMEAGERQQMVKQAGASARWNKLPNTGNRPRPGFIPIKVRQKIGSETAKNVRGD